MTDTIKDNKIENDLGIYPVETLVKFYVEKCNSLNLEISHLKLQKLVYFSHCWWLYLYDRNLIPETFNAGKYGTNLKKLYMELKITEYVNNEKYVKDILKNKKYNLKEGSLLQAFLNNMWYAYGDKSDLELSAIDHVPNSPWRLAKERNSEYISRADIKNWIGEIVKRNNDKNLVDDIIKNTEKQGVTI